MKACVVSAYDLLSLFVILWEQSPRWTLGLNLTAQSMLWFIMDWSLFLNTSTESQQFNVPESAPVSLPLPWHWKQVWVFSLQHNPYFCIPGFIWTFEDLIMRRNICVCVYIGMDVVESIFLPFSVGGIAFLLSAVEFPGVTGLTELGAVFWQQHRHWSQLSGALKSSGMPVAELGVITAASGASLLQGWPFQLLPRAGAEGKETPSLPQELGHQFVCPYGEERHETPRLTSQFLFYWPWGKKCPNYLPLCSCFVRERHWSCWMNHPAYPDW